MKTTMIKKALLSAMMLMSYASVQASSVLHVHADYTPIVVEGKTWEMKLKYSWPANDMECILRCELKGDTTINEIIYKKYYEDGEYQGAFRIGKGVKIERGAHVKIISSEINF